MQNQEWGPPPPPPPGGWPAAPMPTPSVPAPIGSSARTIGWVMLGLATVVAVAAFLPWAEAFGITVTGIGGDDVGGAKDGVITLVLAIPAGVLGLLRGLGRASLGAAIAALVVGLLITLIALVDIGDIRNMVDLGAASVSVGAGLWVTLVAGLGLIAAGTAGLVRRR